MGSLTDAVPADVRTGTVIVLGIPFDAHSSHLRGAAGAPRAIRRAMASGSTNWCAENGVDLAAEPRFMDLGDMALTDDISANQEIYEGVHQLLKRGARILALGGDHAVTYPIVKAHAAIHGALTILHVDAHPDLYDTFQGDRYSHACPFARIMEENLAHRLIQIGIRAANPHQRNQAKRFGIETHEMSRWPTQPLPAIREPIYLSLDLDALDPAFAPGVSHHEPGGLSTREVIGLIQHLQVPVMGADIVELNPDRDLADITAMTAAKLMKEIAAKMIRQPPKQELQHL